MAKEVVVYTDVTVFYPVLEAIKRGSEVYAFCRRQADDAADVLRRAAPVRSGAGRASVRSSVEMGPEGWYGVASWDESHYYLGILNTKDAQSREGWADRAAAQVRYV
jgi:hypothetical protein